MAGYGADNGFASWLTANGYTLPNDAPSPAILRQRGSDYVDGMYGDQFPGTPADPLNQERAWPRNDATIYGVAIPSDATPDRVVNASYFAAWHEANNPGSLSVAVVQAGQIKRKKIGPLETEFFAPEAGTAAATPVLSAVEGLLAPLICQPDVAVFVV